MIGQSMMNLIELGMVILGMWGAFYLGSRKDKERLYESSKQIEVPAPEMMPDETATEDEYLKHFREAVEGKPNGEAEV